MKNKPIIAVDIDDVLADFASFFVDYSNRNWQSNLTHDDFNEDYGQVWGVDRDETTRRAQQLHDPALFLAIAPNFDALATLLKLKENYELIIATSRRSSLTEATHSWLEKHYGGIFDRVYFSGIYDGVITAKNVTRTKRDLLVEHGVDYLIDDQIKHCFGAAGSGVQAVLFGDRGWNKHDDLPAGVTRCVDWTAVEAYFADKR